MDKGLGRPWPAWQRKQPWVFADMGTMVYVGNGLTTAQPVRGPEPMHDIAFVRRQFLGGAGAVAVAMAAGPASAGEGLVPAIASDDDASVDLRSQPNVRVALPCLLRSATALG